MSEQVPVVQVLVQVRGSGLEQVLVKATELALAKVPVLATVPEQG